MEDAHGLDERQVSLNVAVEVVVQSLKWSRSRHDKRKALSRMLGGGKQFLEFLVHEMAVIRFCQFVDQRPASRVT